MARGEQTCVVASYNIHRCIGRDRHHDPDRVVAVIRELDADVIGLQETESRFGTQDDIHQLEYLARNTGYQYVAGVTMYRPDSHYGNGLLTCVPVTAVRRHDTSVPGREPRGVLDVTLEMHGQALRVLVTHLGLTWRERRRQAQLIETLVAETDNRPTVLLADFNEWLPWGGALHRMHRCFGRTPAPRTFPAHRPFFRLDRIWTQPRDALIDIYAHRTPNAGIASDHLPVVARLALQNAPCDALGDMRRWPKTAVPCLRRDG